MKKVQASIKTSNLALAAFLLCRQAELIDVEHESGSSRAFFLFLGNKKTQDLFHEYQFSKRQSPELMVDFRDAFYAIKSIKERLYSKHDER